MSLWSLLWSKSTHVRTIKEKFVWTSDAIVLQLYRQTQAPKPQLPQKCKIISSNEGEKKGVRIEYMGLISASTN